MKIGRGFKRNSKGGTKRKRTERIEEEWETESEGGNEKGKQSRRGRGKERRQL
jgi:hypothetical protein